MESVRVTVFDTTLRDGEQSPGCSMTINEKLRMAHQLDRLSVDVIEAGFPAASGGDWAAVNAVATHFRRPAIAALARACDEDITCAGKALAPAHHPRIHTFIATSDIHLTYKLRRSREQVLDQACQAVKLARTFADEVEFSPEDATRTDLDYLCQVVREVIAAGATVVNIPDTVGYTIPSEMSVIIKTLFERVDNIHQATISVHCHNDLGLAVANSLAAIEAGARQVECTINGIGERAGNASLEELVMALSVRRDVLAYQTQIASELLFPTSQLLSEITNIPVQPNKAIVGRNAFAHEAGIHQDGVLKNRLTYEIMTPESVGVPENRLVLGKHSGRHALIKHFERLGYRFDRFEIDRLYRHFISLADQKKEITDSDLISLAEDVHEISRLTA
ncbi:MAG: 2-isopropylmalate synthase [Acidobacteria bacterium]|nr:2-isopropylmalate synthase [Acidobacteriota bacterium]